MDETGDSVGPEPPRGWSRFVSLEMMVRLGSPVETSSAGEGGWRSFGRGVARGVGRTSSSVDAAIGGTGTARCRAGSPLGVSSSAAPRNGTRLPPAAAQTMSIGSASTALDFARA